MNKFFITLTLLFQVFAISGGGNNGGSAYEIWNSVLFILDF
ncbi:hypothetical protein [Pseudoalteromonas phenolica]|nr:hypothetical protein [Pseudoalteromonas phenolica]